MRELLSSVQKHTSEKGVAGLLFVGRNLAGKEGSQTPCPPLSILLVVAAQLEYGNRRSVGGVLP